jgi:hypothetical protein
VSDWAVMAWDLTLRPPTEPFAATLPAGGPSMLIFDPRTGKRVFVPSPAPMPQTSFLRFPTNLPGQGEPFTDKDQPNIAATHRHAGLGTAIAVLIVPDDID